MRLVNAFLSNKEGRQEVEFIKEVLHQSEATFIIRPKDDPSSNVQFDLLYCNKQVDTLFNLSLSDSIDKI